MVVFDFRKEGGGIFIMFGIGWWRRRRSHGVGDEEGRRENENKQKKNIWNDSLPGGVVNFDREGAGIRKAKIKG